MKQQVTILGSTGSIGCSTLEVISLNEDKYQVYALSAKSNADLLLTQCLKYRPAFAVILDEVKALWLTEKIARHGLSTKILYQARDLLDIVMAPDVDIVMSALVGSCGLLPTYQAIMANKKVLLANKESLVTGGKLIVDLLKSPNNKATLIPVDSEHSAIFQAMSESWQQSHYFRDNLMLKDQFNQASGQVKKIILTASGGPFRNYSKEQLKQVTPEDATKHPNWSMGKKITVDSSTLMNKGLEVIEAYWLFEQVPEVIVHPQSIIHSMVEYIDGSVIAQLGVPDMKTPIAYALSYPKRINSGVESLNLAKVQNLTFEEVDHDRFPCLNLAFKALSDSSAMPAVLNAANEVAVAMFLDKQINYGDIYKVNALTMEKFTGIDFKSVEEILVIDQEARSYAAQICCSAATVSKRV